MQTQELPGIEGQGYIFTCKGQTQLYRHKGVTGLLVAATRAAAKRMVDSFKSNGIRLSIMEVGMGGVSLYEHFAALTQDASGVYLTKDGRTLDFYEAGI